MNEELRTRILGLRPRQFQSRLAYWRRADLPSGAGDGERVSGSRGHKMLGFDPQDRDLIQAEADYRSYIDGLVAACSTGDHGKAWRFVVKAEALEQKYLFVIQPPTEEMIKQMEAFVSDAKSCRTCDETKETFLKRNPKGLWRTRAGDCPACAQAKRRARLAELQVIDPEPIQATG